eukprot:307265-Rhodomonas_salina.1
MTSLIQCSPNPMDPIHSSFALTTANALVWTAKQTKRIVVQPAFRAALLSEAHDLRQSPPTEVRKRCTEP